MKYALECGCNEYVTDPTVREYGYGQADSFSPDTVLWVEAESQADAEKKFEALGYKGHAVAEETLAAIFDPENE